MQPATPDKRSAPAGADKPHPDPEVVAKIVRGQWAIVAGRQGWRSHLERIHALEDSGLIMDDVNFPRIASGLG